MDATEKANLIVREQMYANDPFSKWLGIEIIEVSPGYCKLQMTIGPDMLNGFNLAHGGISFSLADSALAFASNGHGIQSLSIQTDIRHLKPLKLGDLVVAEAFEESVSRQFGHYRVELKSNGNLVGLFKGLVYRTSQEWNLD